MSILLEMYHALQACVGVYLALLSAMAIYSLRQWEPQTETASKYSNVASRELQKTRATQTSGAIAVRTGPKALYSEMANCRRPCHQ